MTKCFVFDIDGTLADCDHRLYLIREQPKRWDEFFAACPMDAPIPHMVDLARALCRAGETIVYVSGRSDQSRGETADWLANHRLPAGPLYMRKRGDHRNDDILKVDLLARVREDGFDPIMAFDDRTRVVDAWRSAGIPCAQVAPGDF